MIVFRRSLMALFLLLGVQRSLSPQDEDPPRVHPEISAKVDDVRLTAVELSRKIQQDMRANERNLGAAVATVNQVFITRPWLNPNVPLPKDREGDREPKKTEVQFRIIADGDRYRLIHFENGRDVPGAKVIQVNTWEHSVFREFSPPRGHLAIRRFDQSPGLSGSDPRRPFLPGGLDAFPSQYDLLAAGNEVGDKSRYWLECQSPGGRGDQMRIICDKNAGGLPVEALVAAKGGIHKSTITLAYLDFPERNARLVQKVITRNYSTAVAYEPIDPDDWYMEIETSLTDVRLLSRTAADPEFCDESNFGEIKRREDYTLREAR